MQKKKMGTILFFVNLLDVEESGKVGERVTASQTGKELDNCLTPEPRVFRDGVRCRRGPDDAHPCRRVHRA